MLNILSTVFPKNTGNEFLIFSVSIVVVTIFLLYDLGVFSKVKDHIITTKEALLKTCMWVILSVLFCIFLRFQGDLLHGINNSEELGGILKKFGTKLNLLGDFSVDIDNYRKILATDYITGYLMEYALSIDNIFVIMLILQSLNIPQKNYHKVLFLGIVGAIVLRFLLIFIGSMLISKFAWILYVFGAFLIYAGVNMFLSRNKKDKVNINNYWIVRFIRKYIPIDETCVDGRFVTRVDGIKHITNLFIALTIIEFSDLVFALDSIPAIFAITKDPYIIFFSNIFAILGLRSLFFLLNGIMDKFRFLKVGLAILLVFIGFKMLFADLLYKLGYKTIHSLILIVIILASSIILSQVIPNKEKQKAT